MVNMCLRRVCACDGVNKGIPVYWNVDTSNNVRSYSLHCKLKVVRNEVARECFSLIKQVKFRLNDVDKISSAKQFVNSFVSNENNSRQDSGMMRDVWICIEDNKVIMDTIVDE